MPGLWAVYYDGSFCPDCGLVFLWWFFVVWAVACSYIYRGGAARFFLRLIVASGLVYLYSLVWRWPFGNKFLIIQKKNKKFAKQASDRGGSNLMSNG